MEQSLDRIYRAHVHDLSRFLLFLSRDPHTAEDLVQETFFRAYLHLEQYRGGSVKSWLFAIAYRAYLDHYRKHRRVVVKEQRFFAGLSAEPVQPDALIVREKIREIVRLLEHLPEKQRFAVLLHDFHGLSQAEAADVMNVPKSHFKVLLFRGRQAIRRRKAGEHDG
jgi:RNA polymerase sigma-70 factor (ECF subfamily)